MEYGWTLDSDESRSTVQIPIVPQRTQLRYGIWTPYPKGQTLAVCQRGHRYDQSACRGVYISYYNEKPFNPHTTYPPTHLPTCLLSIHPVPDSIPAPLLRKAPPPSNFGIQFYRLLGPG